MKSFVTVKHPAARSKTLKVSPEGLLLGSSVNFFSERAGKFLLNYIIPHSSNNT